MKISKDIPVPSHHKYDWDFINDMDYGDSFYIEADGVIPNYSLPMVSVRYWAKKRGILITAKKEGTGFRVWKLKKHGNNNEKN